VHGDSQFDGPAETITLYRPVGPKELALIQESGYRAFPPRLPEQPIFYPVCTEEYAAEIASKWNATSPRTGYRGYVTRFHVEAEFARRYPVQTVGGRRHQELWVPAEELPDFNAHIVGLIEVIAEYHSPPGDG
jgi:hypothetical protein